MDVSSVQCSCVIEWFDQHKVVSRRVKYSSATIRLLRNQFRELFIEVENMKAKQKFEMVDVTIHKKFIMEGKASISMNKINVVIMLSNAPTAHLLPFLKTVFIKLTSKKQSPSVKLREQLLSNKMPVLQEISPINNKDVTRTKVELGKTNQNSKKRHQEEKTDLVKKKQCIYSLIQSIKPTPEQQEVLDAVTTKQNIFFTGSAGTGKSCLLRWIINTLPPDEVVVTASTGCAACLIGGITLHSFTGIGSGDVTLKRGIELASRNYVAQNWRKCKYLIIDEISMIDGDYFEKIEEIAKVIRNNQNAFGGIKLILCGDFLQLPPVRKNSKAKFCFQTEAWSKCQFRCFNLKQVHRQSNDPVLIQVLNDIRIGRITEETVQKLKSTSKHILEKDGIVPTQLCCKTTEAQIINDNKLNNLRGTEKIYIAVDEGFEQTLDEQTPVVKKLILKEGAQVMLLKNINLADGLSNGARGIVTGFTPSGLPVVQFMSGIKQKLDTEKWVVKSANGSISTRRQIPLKLAWAFSIHKSQGLTLDCVEMSLSGVFEAGQAYVALSRAKSFSSLRVRDFDPKQVWANPDVLKFYRKLDFYVNATRLYPVVKSTNSHFNVKQK